MPSISATSRAFAAGYRPRRKITNSALANAQPRAALNRGTAPCSHALTLRLSVLPSFELASMHAFQRQNVRSCFPAREHVLRLKFDGGSANSVAFFGQFAQCERIFSCGVTSRPVVTLQAISRFGLRTASGPSIA